MIEDQKTASPRVVSLIAILLVALLVLFSVQSPDRVGSQAAAALPLRLSPSPTLAAEAYLVRLTPRFFRAAEAPSDEINPHTFPQGILEGVGIKTAANQAGYEGDNSQRQNRSVAGQGAQLPDRMILFSQRAAKRLAPASLTKLMTAAVAAEYLAPDEIIVFSDEAKAVEKRLSSAPAGEVFLRDEAVRLALISSANDAALALADAVGRRLGRVSYRDRIELFVQLMNRTASRWGLANTRFRSPTGLDLADQYTSAEDLSQMAIRLLAHHPELWEMTRQYTETVFSWQRRQYPIQNTNELLTEFPALSGGKTGFTDEAGGALLLLYPVEPDQVAIIVILKSDDRFGDGRKIIKWLEDNF